MHLRASSHEFGRPGWPAYHKDEFHLGFIWEISARFPRWEKAEDDRELWHEIRELSKRGETQSYNFRAYYSFGNSYSCITVVKRDAYDVKRWCGKYNRKQARRERGVRRSHPPPPQGPEVHFSVYQWSKNKVTLFICKSGLKTLRVYFS